MEFGVKYAEQVSVYSIGTSGDINNETFSLEFCGGPHVKNTSELTKFKIQKEYLTTCFWLNRPHLKSIFQGISAKVDGEPCCDWVGQDGSGHFVKMVHNGIEYGDMQLICEAYDIMHNCLDMTADEIGDVLDHWNKTELDSFLIEITANILQYKENGETLLYKIKDSAGQVIFI